MRLNYISSSSYTDMRYAICTDIRICAMRYARIYGYALSIVSHNLVRFFFSVTFNYDAGSSPLGVGFSIWPQSLLSSILHYLGYSQRFQFYRTSPGTPPPRFQTPPRTAHPTVVLKSYGFLPRGTNNKNSGKQFATIDV